MTIVVEINFGYQLLYVSNMLKIIADSKWYRPENPGDYMDDTTRKYYSEHQYIVSSWWYLHGDLESIVGYDKGVFCNLEEFPLLIKNCYFNGNKEYFDVVCLKDGIYDVEVIGIKEPCIGYFWISNHYDIPECRGLVCLKSDKEGCEYAFKKYNEKSIIL